MWLDFATAESIMALRRDSLDGVQSVQVDVSHPDEISTLFDGAIVYAKGARLLRMCQQYVGHDAFQAGLKAYFTAHAYSNTEGDDLWKALSEASGKDITSLMNAWISQPGYPVVTVSADNGALLLKQQRFFVGPHEPSNTLWPIPLNASDSTVPQLLDTVDQTVNYRRTGPLRLNVGDSAHFITHYDNALLGELIAQIDSGTLQPLDKVQLLHEQTLLARGNIISSAALIPLLAAYKNEVTEPVWDIISLAIGELKKFVETDDDAELHLRKLAGTLAQPQYERLGWKPSANESESETKLRTTIIAMMIYSQDIEALDMAKKLYDASSLENLDPELRALIISAVVRNYADDATIEALISAYKTTPSADLQQDIASGLTSTRNEAIIQKLLGLVTDSSIIRHQDVTHWFVWLIRDRNGRTLAWQWLRDNWKWVEATFGGDKSYDDFPRYAAGALVSRTQLQEYKDFFTPLQSVPALTRIITIGIGEIEGRVELIERDSDAVRQALRQL
jgi:aminopeptidase N